MLAEVVRDEPNWQGLFYIERIELSSESLNQLAIGFLFREIVSAPDRAKRWELRGRARAGRLAEGRRRARVRRWPPRSGRCANRKE